MAGRPDTLLSIRDLSIWFGHGGNYLRAVNRVSMEIGKGEIVGLIGQSGSGKTTLAMGLLGLVRGYPGLWSGEAALDGKSLLPDMGRFIVRKDGDNLSTFRVRLTDLLRGSPSQDDLTPRAIPQLRGGDSVIVP